MLVLAANEALKVDFGLLVTFGGINVVVFAIIGFIAFQVRGERQQNQEYMRERRPPRV